MHRVGAAATLVAALLISQTALAQEWCGRRGESVIW